MAETLHEEFIIVIIATRVRRSNMFFLFVRWIYFCFRKQRAWAAKKIVCLSQKKVACTVQRVKNCVFESQKCCKWLRAVLDLFQLVYLFT